MNPTDKLIERAGLTDLAEKVAAAERLTPDDARRLYACPDLNVLGTLANHVRERINGNRATYVFNMYLNYSNVCILSCQFCAFARKKGEDGAYQYTIEDMAAEARAGYETGMTEVHIVGGLHPALPFAYYLDMIRAIKTAAPGMKVKAFTAVEIKHLAKRKAKLPLRETLETLREAGLDALTGGGAEIFDQGVRDQICRGKETADEWLDIHRTWHRLGMRSTATMLYHHVETLDQRIDHLRRLRDLQDETGGFTGFVPYAFEPENNELAHLPRATAYDEIRQLAIARLFLDNFDHITAYWISLGLPMAQIALSYGVDDLHGTIKQEKIFHMAGAQTPQEQTVAKMEKAIREAGRDPAQRNTFYDVIEPTAPPVEPAFASAST